MKHIQEIDPARRARLKQEADAWAARSPYAGLVAALKARRAELAHDDGSE